jgi:hypothetical protein
MEIILSRMNNIERETFREQFSRELNRICDQQGALEVYEKLGLSRETGRQCKTGRLPSKTPGVLEKAIQMGFALTYDGRPLTLELLESLREPSGAVDSEVRQYRQLELFTEDGLIFEINRIKAASEITVSIRVRRA